MSKDLSEESRVHTAEVVRHGEKITLPEDMSINDAIRVLKRRSEYENTEVNLSREFNAHPYDVAAALQRAIAERWGWVNGVPTPGFFSNSPPEKRVIPVGVGRTIEVMWGRIALPGVPGWVAVNVSRSGSVGVVAETLNGYSKTITDLFDAVEAELNAHSIYAGKAIRVRFLDGDGDEYLIPEPEFMPTDLTRNDLIYSADVMEQVETNLFAPIERVDDCLLNEIPVKRGVILGGVYGTGKTLAATVAARLAVENGITFVYVPHADELGHALEFAKRYATRAAVVFCEDIDREINGERTVEMDDILNTLDGLDSKTSPIITILTTNHLETINPAMLRPGRLDAVIDVKAPDAEAIQKLIRHYGGSTIAPEADISEASAILDGSIPAVIAEVVKRAKLAQLRRQPRGERVSLISPEALTEAAISMRDHVDLLHRRSQPGEERPAIETALTDVVAKALNGTKERVQDIAKRVGA